MASHPVGGKVSPETTTDQATMNADKADGGPAVVLVNYNKNGSVAGDDDRQSAATATKTSDNRIAMNDVHGNESDHADPNDQEPLWLCKMIVEHPKKAFGVALALHLFMLLLTVLLLASGYDILPLKVEALPLDIRDDTDYLRGLAWQEKLEGDDIIDRNALADANQTERSVLYDTIEIFFEKEGGNVFTKTNLELIRDVENEYFYNYVYNVNKSSAPDPESITKSYCLSDGQGGCVKPSSVLRYFDGTYQDLNPDLYDPNFEDIPKVLYEVEITDELKKDFQAFLGRDAIINGTHAISDITYSAIYVGLPLKGYISTSDDETKQEDDVMDFEVDQFKDLGDHYFDKGVGDMHFFYYSQPMLINEIRTQVFLDLALAGASMGFIAIFMCIQTGTLWVSLFAVFSILCCFFTTNFIYRVVCDFRYLGVFHILSVFIVLGIGADDVFVFFDTWRESAHRTYPSLAHRLSAVYRSASIAMLFTSITTAVAFIVSAFSPFLGIWTFGVFSGILIIVNYLSVILFFPTVVITYHLYWSKFKCCCCCPRDDQGAGPGKKNFMVRFLAGPYFKFVTHKIIRFVILAVYIGLFAFLVVSATDLEVDDQQPQFLKEDSNFGQYQAKRQTQFKPGNADNTLKILLIWGMKEQDVSDCHLTDPDCWGKNVWDNDFDLDPTDAQKALLDLCYTLRNMTDDQLAKLEIAKDLVNEKPEVQCFLDDMKTFYEKEEMEGYYGPNANLDVPAGQQQANTIMTNSNVNRTNTDVYMPMATGWTRYFEVVMSYWLYDAFSIMRDCSSGIGETYFLNDELLGESVDPPYTQETTLCNRYNYSYGTRLRYATIVVNSSLQTLNLAYEDGLVVRDRWEDWMNEQMSNMPSSVKGGFQLSAYGADDFNEWHWLKVQENLVLSAIQGVLIGCGFAIPVLIIATHNWIVGIMASCTIIIITVSVIALIPLLGWKLGLLESLNLVLVVGLAVDYVVHLAEGYSRSPAKDRRGRTKDTLEEVGISVLSGAITTLGASFFLIFAEIRFFLQFGYFMFGTIGFSIIYSLGLFITVIGLIGPQNEFGSTKPFTDMIKSLFRKCCKCCRR